MQRLSVSKTAYKLPLKQVVAYGNQRSGNNKGFSEASLQGLANSIARDGLTQPITVRPLGYICPTCEKGYETADTVCCQSTVQQRYKVVAGERRYRAISMLGWDTIPAFVQEMTAEEEALVMAHENIGRVDLNPIEECDVYVMFRGKGYEIDDIASRCGTTVAQVKSRLKLNQLVLMARSLVAQGSLPVGQAEELALLEPMLQQKALAVLGKQALTYNQFKMYLNDLRTAETEQAQFALAQVWIEKAEEAAGFQADMRSGNSPFPVRDDLPEAQGHRRMTAGDIIVKYMYELMDAGLQEEAGVIGRLMETLIQYRKVKNFQRPPQVQA